MNRATGRRQRRTSAVLLRIAAGLVGAFLLAALALPLVVRGPVARWVVGRAAASMCGTIRIGGAHAGWAAAIDLLLRRPVPLVVEDLEIKGPDGQIVLAAARVETEIAFHRGGVVVVPRLWIAHGRWRLDLDSEGLGTADAFRTVPLAGRAACLDPHAARPASRRGAGGGGLDVRRIELADVDAELNFDSWGMTLTGAAAVGSLSAGDPPLLFEAHDVVARGGSVRVGGRRGPWRTVVPFDAVAIARVGVLRDAPTDLVLDVARGVTGPSLLSGRASFNNIFLGAGGRRPSGPPGLDADVRWIGLRGALSRFEAPWRPGEMWLRRMDGDLHALVRGPFSALEGMLQIDGGRTKVTARLAAGTADLRVVLGGVDTAWMMDPALRPLLAGELHGRLHATARLAPAFAGVEADIPDADLRLDRPRAPRGPRRYELRIGAASRVPETAEALYASIGRIRLTRGVLRLDALRVDWTGLSGAVDAEVAFATDAARGERSRVDARGSLSVVALEDWVPDGIASGPLRIDAQARGTLERLELKLALPPPSTVTVFGQRFGLPRRVDVAMDRDSGVRFSPLELRRAGGGTIQLKGRVGPDDRLAVGLAMRDYPLAGVPGVSQAGLPALAGVARGDLALGGRLDRPEVSGKLGVSGLAIARKPLGDLAADLHIAGESGTVSATIDPGLTLHARVRRRTALAVDAEIDARDRPLGAWLPPPLAGAPVAVSGRATLGFRSGAPIKADADMTATGPGLSGVRVAARVRGPDGSGHVAGTIDLARWPQLWPHLVKGASGVVDLDLSVQDAFVRPRAAGSLRVARDLVVRATAWPAPLTLASGARFDLDGTGLTVSGLALSTPGLVARVAGRATVDFANLDRSSLALRLDGDLDAARFPMRLPGGASVAGRLAVAAQIGGTLAGMPGPRVDGSLRLDDVTVRLSPTAPLARGRGVVEAHGDLVRTSGVDVQVDGVGLVHVGRPDAPATTRVLSLSPFRLGEIDVPFSGGGLTIGSRASELYVPDLDAALRLSGDARGELTLGGEVSVSGGVLDTSKRSPLPATAKPRVGGAWWRSLPPHLTLDLNLRGTNKGIRVEVPVLPDVTVDFRCHLHATNRGANWTGRLRGDSAYARAAVTIFDWFRPEDLRGCQLTK